LSKEAQREPLAGLLLPTVALQAVFALLPVVA
jgi:hypothetical protein